MLVVDLGKWMNKILIDWGIDAKVADRFDETIIAILMIAIAVGVDYLCQAILVGGMRQYTRRKPHLWNTLLMKRKDSYDSRHPCLCPVADGFHAWQGTAGYFAEGLCHLYHLFFAAGYQWDSADDHGYLRWKGDNEEPTDERIHSSTSGTFVFYRGDCDYLYPCK